MSLDLNKPHKGSINNWTKKLIPKSEGDYGLQFKIVGVPIDHPQYQWALQTSYVVAQEGNEIETRNSRYTLLTELKI